MKRILVFGALAVLLVLGSLLLPSSVPGRSADERLVHGLPIPFVRQRLAGHGPVGPGPWAYRGPALAPQEYPTDVSEAALVADVVIVGVGLCLGWGLLWVGSALLELGGALLGRRRGRLAVARRPPT